MSTIAQRTRGAIARRQLENRAFLDNAMSLEDIGGHEDILKYVKRNIIWPWQNPALLGKGPRQPKGILFYGPPGTGKTLMAQAIAKEMQTAERRVSFFHLKASECLSRYFGETANNIREAFRNATDNQPSIIFIDEIEGLCPSRDRYNGSEVWLSVVTTLLGLIDNIERGTVIVIGATNRLEAIDPAMLQPGRFDRKFYFGVPNEEARRKILLLYTGKWKHQPTEEQIDVVVQATSGFTGAELNNVVGKALDCSLTRHNPNFDPDLIASQRVTTEDWLEAVRQANKTNINSYVLGSKLVKTSPLEEKLRPLLNHQVDALAEAINNIRPTFSIDSFTGFNSIIMDEVPANILDQELIKTKIIPAALDTVDNMPLYVLDGENIVNCLRRFNLVGTNSYSMCCLLIPSLDTLYENLVPEMKDAFLRAIQGLRNKPVLIIATTEEEATDLPIELRDIFNDRVLQFQAPDKTQVEAFFDQLKTTKNSKACGTDIKAQIKDIFGSGKSAKISVTSIIERFKSLGRKHCN